MSKSNQNPFDVPVDGMPDRYLTMPELMACYESFKAGRDYENAKAVLDYGIRSGYLPAKLEMARLLKNTPQLAMTQKERYAQAEKLYREILNVLDLSDRAAGAVSMELAGFYGTINRPVACLGAMLKARRLVFSVPEKDIALCRRRLNRMDINAFCENPRDCYDLGSELALAGAFKFGEWLLRESCSSRDPEQVGRS